jgi:hypothetical protein
VQVAERQDPHGSRSYARAVARPLTGRLGTPRRTSLPWRVWRAKQAAPFIDRPSKVV